MADYKQCADLAATPRRHPLGVRTKLLERSRAQARIRRQEQAAYGCSGPDGALAGGRSCKYLAGGQRLQCQGIRSRLVHPVAEYYRKTR